MLETLCEQLCALHLELPRQGLVTWTSGNISARDPVTGRVAIKASGIRYEAMGAQHMVVVDLDGKIIQSNLRPSSDVATHLYIYRQRPDIHGIVHTHSPYATAWAGVGQEIPCVLTAMADEFGGPIPCGGFALIGGEEIGREVVRVLETTQSPGILLQNHGVFAVGPTAEAALKAAVMVEDAARTVWLAKQLGDPIPIAPEDVARLHKRYTTEYGQGNTVKRKT